MARRPSIFIKAKLVFNIFNGQFAHPHKCMALMVCLLSMHFQRGLFHLGFCLLFRYEFIRPWLESNQGITPTLRLKLLELPKRTKRPQHYPI